LSIQIGSHPFTQLPYLLFQLLLEILNSFYISNWPFL
jgi:hypothetical protein